MKSADGELKQPKLKKDSLVSWFTQNVGGVDSYWRKIPAIELRALRECIKSDADVCHALHKIVKLVQERSQTNTRLNQKNFGLLQTASRNERVADELTKRNAVLEDQLDQALKSLQDMMDELLKLENSEILGGIKFIRQQINDWISS